MRNKLFIGIIVCLTFLTGCQTVKEDIKEVENSTKNEIVAKSEQIESKPLTDLDKIVPSKSYSYLTQNVITPEDYGIIKISSLDDWAKFQEMCPEIESKVNFNASLFETSTLFIVRSEKLEVGPIYGVVDAILDEKIITFNITEGKTYREAGMSEEYISKVGGVALLCMVEKEVADQVEKVKVNFVEVHPSITKSE